MKDIARFGITISFRGHANGEDRERCERRVEIKVQTRLFSGRQLHAADASFDNRDTFWKKKKTFSICMKVYIVISGDAVHETPTCLKEVRNVGKGKIISAGRRAPTPDLLCED